MTRVVDDVSANPTIDDRSSGTTADLAPVDRRTFVVAVVLLALTRRATRKSLG